MDVWTMGGSDDDEHAAAVTAPSDDGLAAARATLFDGLEGIDAMIAAADAGGGGEYVALRQPACLDASSHDSSVCGVEPTTGHHQKATLTLDCSVSTVSTSAVILH